MAGEGKTDMERIGLFSEMEYITIGDTYFTALNRPFNEEAGKGRQMFPGGSKIMSDLQAGYFDAQFKRVFTGEGYSNPIKLKRQHRMEEAKKNIGKVFLPSNGDKKSSGLGSYYGTLGGPMPAFSGQLKARDPYIAPGKNFYTNPGKLGTGYGYPNLTIGKPYSYSSESYEGAARKKGEVDDEQALMKGGPFKLNLYPREYFDANPYQSDEHLPPVKKSAERKVEKPFRPSSPAKKMGGMKAGTFDPYPSHSNEPYRIKREKETTTNKSGKIFHPLSSSKTRPIRSILQAYVLKSVNPVNYKTLSLASY
ncbi:UPF0602 protein C4orf47 homolog [Rhinatrema bivittatum]|uniref:UPF0602 protein C4orf47 homolog n=1 Tax=Rhinatrema bivittatum TaxID=194408 RepID=UPI00112B23A2|nr:UPF0602 protein C4orf47 homolog [Rhinatrema bivittatum]XP_029442784.1 UPF0602 protein C4orf47 homolog [Rhinatrema bivittatum]XP_029442785.1 UPF0602 protein C4orf47 homolog [Rhinatrema bivittatum]XP_029442786.1 UPF0602 protein C4orf47 homolog [Rhinatrema bivittatum]XP_029442787.1 UPF0602 protein C4orf47 homolog [Rhinatrema bivittatum]XP_029442788.1 UPF0602 protein C4orf47 homolog [Rhinatrema bivittatum]XP_029442789.1 UPF0602 protein C4orf47 homolog [Rhinatrema bivittatum]